MTLKIMYVDTSVNKKVFRKVSKLTDESEGHYSRGMKQLWLKYRKTKILTDSFEISHPKRPLDVLPDINQRFKELLHVELRNNALQHCI